MKTIYILKKSFKGNTQDLMAYVDKDEAQIELLRLKEENPTIEYFVTLLGMEDNVINDNGYCTDTDHEGKPYLETGDEDTCEHHKIEYNYMDKDCEVFEGGVSTGDSYKEYQLESVLLYNCEVYPINKARLSDDLVKRIVHECNNVIETL